MQDKPKGRYVWLWLLVPIVLVAAFFFFEWLGSEQPQRLEQAIRIISDVVA